jgi:methionyl-tRNA synthetase
MVFSHGFVYRRKTDTGELVRESKTMGGVTEPMDLVTKFSAEAFRYYFMRECPFPGDGEFSWERFIEVYNTDLANNLGNLYSRVVTLITKNYGSRLDGTAGVTPAAGTIEGNLEQTVREIRAHVEACRYNQALEVVWRQLNDPANRYADRTEPWKLVKSDKQAAKEVLYGLVEPLRRAAILLKPFLPKTAERIYRSFNFPQPWEQVRYQDVWQHPGQTEDLRVLATLKDGKVEPLFPRISS